MYRVEKYMAFRLSKRENELLLAAEEEVKLLTGSIRPAVGVNLNEPCSIVNGF
jgi:hypothetical protein